MHFTLWFLWCCWIGEGAGGIGLWGEKPCVKGSWAGVPCLCDFDLLGLGWGGVGLGAGASSHAYVALTVLGN